MKIFIFSFLLFVQHMSLAAYSLSAHQKTRRDFHNGALAIGGCLTGIKFPSLGMGTWCSAMDGAANAIDSGALGSEEASASTIAFKALQLPVNRFGTTVPVACWYPVGDQVSTTQSNARGGGGGGVKYSHRISVKRIGQLLAGWDFIPEFFSRKFVFTPKSSLLDGGEISFPSSPKVVFLAHGYLGSRFDLSHIGEELASQGFVCISAEYPESLAASYQRQEGLDRGVINKVLLDYVQSNLKPSSYAGIGHSLGCGTILNMGDSSWTRILIAGRAPAASSSPLLFISSVNDGAVAFGGPMVIPDGYTMLEESNIPSKIPSTSALIFDRADAPNHISYLSENVNEAMVSFLSPLLPVAQALSIPVLDFDKYQTSRDSVPTFEILKPVITTFLAQQMTDSKEH
jgi:hypothetical protein